MRKFSKVAIGVSLVAAAATVLAACSSSGGGGGGNTSSAPSGAATGGTNSAKAGYNAAFNSIVNPSTKTGGTLQLGATADCDSWDPKIAYYGWCWNMQRLYSRTLVGYSVVNGTKFKFAPDLATSMGTHNANYTKWTYTLKPGLKWSNGKAITPLDVKYGIERNWASAEIPGGPSSYFTQGILAPKGYKGPYKGGSIPTITTTPNSITITLSGPNADFDYLMAMGASAPVPDKTEGGPGFVGATYTKHPMSSGPFMIKSYTPGKSMIFVRNPYWSQSSDTDPAPEGQRGRSDHRHQPGGSGQQAQGRHARRKRRDRRRWPDADSSSPTCSRTRTAKKQADDPTTAYTQYLVVMQTVIKNADCRKAIFYATNKASIIAAAGGPTNGIIAESMTPPGIEGYDGTYNPFPVGADNTGDIAKAKDALKACGKPNGFTVKFAYPTPSTKAPLVFQAEKSALARVGIKLTAATDDASTYYTTFIGSPKNIINQQIGMAYAGWGADFPTGVGFYQAIANGNAIVDPGNSNYPSLNDPTVNKVLDAAPAGNATAADWQSLNHAVMDSTVYLPLWWGNTLMYRNPRMTNVTCNNAQAFGNYDFVNIGVSS